MALGTNLNKEEVNKRKIDRALEKAEGGKTTKVAQTPARPVSSSQAKKSDPKIIKTKNNSFSHGFN